MSKGAMISTQFPVRHDVDSVPIPIPISSYTQPKKLRSLLAQSECEMNFSNERDAYSINTRRVESQYIPPMPMTEFYLPEGPSATPLQLWEGRVVSVDESEGIMHVLLVDKLSAESEHTADIDLKFVSPQDRQLVRSGAVFYLTLSLRIKRGGIENAQELRFRRLPAWSKQQLEQIETEAEMLAGNMEPAPIAE